MDEPVVPSENQNEHASAAAGVKPDFPPTHDDTDPGTKFGITRQDVDREYLKWDFEWIKTNDEGIALFERLARKHLDDKAFYDECQEIINALKLDNVEIKKDVEHVRKKLNPAGNKASGDGIRFRMEEDKRTDGNP